MIKTQDDHSPNTPKFPDNAQHSLKVKGRDIYIPPLTGNPDQQRFTMRSGTLTGNDTGGTAQVAAAHCPNERTFDPTVCSQTNPTAPASHTMAFTPQCSPAMTHYF